MREEKISMSVVNPHAAGIDVGSRSHWVAIGQGAGDFREFGVYNEDLYRISAWLKEVALQQTRYRNSYNKQLDKIKANFYKLIFNINVQKQFNFEEYGCDSNLPYRNDIFFRL